MTMSSVMSRYNSEQTEFLISLLTEDDVKVSFILLSLGVKELGDFALRESFLGLAEYDWGNSLIPVHWGTVNLLDDL